MVKFYFFLKKRWISEKWPSNSLPFNGKWIISITLLIQILRKSGSHPHLHLIYYTPYLFWSPFDHVPMYSSPANKHALKLYSVPTIMDGDGSSRDQGCISACAMVQVLSSWYTAWFHFSRPKRFLIQGNWAALVLLQFMFHDCNILVHLVFH